MALITPNPAVPIQVDNVTGQIVIQPDQQISQLGVMGLAVVAEAQVVGNVYLVPAGKTFVGVAILIVGAGSGTITLNDASATPLLAVGGAGITAPGTPVPAFAAIGGISGEIGGGGGNQLKTIASGSAQLISCTVAGYLH